MSKKAKVYWLVCSVTREVNQRFNVEVFRVYFRAAHRADPKNPKAYSSIYDTELVIRAQRNIGEDKCYAFECCAAPLRELAVKALAKISSKRNQLDSLSKLFDVLGAFPVESVPGGSYWEYQKTGKEMEVFDVAC